MCSFGISTALLDHVREKADVTNDDQQSLRIKTDKRTPRVLWKNLRSTLATLRVSWPVWRSPHSMVLTAAARLDTQSCAGHVSEIKKKALKCKHFANHFAFFWQFCLRKRRAPESRPRRQTVDIPTYLLLKTRSRHSKRKVHKQYF